jgi:hypothetical protein
MRFTDIFSLLRGAGRVQVPDERSLFRGVRAAIDPVHRSAWIRAGKLRCHTPERLEYPNGFIRSRRGRRGALWWLYEPKVFVEVMRLPPILSIVALSGVAVLVPAALRSDTIRGYVVDAEGHRVRGARVQGCHLVPTDQRPPQRSRRLGETTTDGRGNFVLWADPREINMVIASFDNQSGAALPSFSTLVRVALRHNRPRPVDAGTQRARK